MKNKKYFFILLIILTFMISSVSANDIDNNNTDVIENHVFSQSSSSTFDEKIGDTQDNIIKKDIVKENVKKSNSTDLKYNENNSFSLEKSIETYEITQDNFEEYFTVTDNVNLNEDKLSANMEYVYNLQYVPSNISKISIVSTEDTLKNTSVKFVAKNIYLNNCGLNVDNTFKNVTFENFEFSYNDEYSSDDYICVTGLTNLCIFNNLGINNEISSIDKKSYLLNINKPTIVENSNIFTKIPEVCIGWNDGDKIPHNTPVVINSENSTFCNNNVIVNINGHDTIMYSCYAIYCSKNKFNCSNNYVAIDDATGYAYAIVIRGSDSIVSNNTIDVDSVAYSAGIDVEGNSLRNNLIKNNNINVIAGENSAPWGNKAAAYAIELLDYSYLGGDYKVNSQTATNISFVNNTVSGFGRQFYGFEVYGGANITIENNIVDSQNSFVTMGVGVIGENITINNNNINIMGQSSDSDDSVDYLQPMTVGIYSTHSQTGIVATDNIIFSENGRGIYAEISNAVIDNNLIYTEGYDYSIEISGSNNSIKYNAINNANENAIKNSGENLIQNNRNYENSSLIINVPEIVNINHEFNITVKLVTENGDVIANQSIDMKVNEKNITIQTDDNGIYTFTYLPQSFGSIEVSVSYTSYRNTGSYVSKKIIALDPDRIILTPNSFDEYITNGTFNDKIKEGSTIDVQGKFDSERYAFNITKPVNIISTSGDAFFCFYSTPKTEGTNELPDYSFIITETGSGTNVTSITFENTMIVTTNAHDIYLIT